MDTNIILANILNKHNADEFKNYRVKIDKAINDALDAKIIYGNYQEFSSNNVRTLFKNYMLRSLHRYTDDFIKDLGYKCIDESVDLHDAIYCNICKSKTNSYFIVLLPSDGKIYKTILNRYNKSFKLAKAHKYGTTQLDYINIEIPYSKYVYNNASFINAGTTMHQMMAACTGLMDNYTLLELATYTTNHKNRNHYDNSKPNLEFVSIQDNNIHKHVTDELIKYKAFYSMSCNACIKYKQLSEYTKSLYIKRMQDIIHTGELYDNINDIVLKDISGG